MSGKKNSNGHENRVVGAVSEMPMNKTRILVADDHPLVREALAAIIGRQTNFIHCGEATSAIETQKAVALHKPDLVLLDLWMDNRDGLELIKDLTSQFPSVRILVLSQCDEALYADRVLRAGARGFVMKEQTASEIVAAIQVVLAGELYIGPKVPVRALHKPVENKPQNGSPGAECLTDRELQVLRLLGAGMSTRKIAEGLQVSFKTVETHRENIKHKLGLSDAMELVHFATTWGRSLEPSTTVKTIAA